MENLSKQLLNFKVTTVGDIFLLSLFIREMRIYLIVQNSIFAILAFIGVVVNIPGGIL